MRLLPLKAVLMDAVRLVLGIRRSARAVQHAGPAGPWGARRGLATRLLRKPVLLLREFAAAPTHQQFCLCLSAPRVVEGASLLSYMSLAATRAALKAHTALQTSASAPRLPNARVLPGGEVVTAGAVSQPQAAEPISSSFRREASALRLETCGSKGILEQFELERISSSTDLARQRLASAPSASETQQFSPAVRSMMYSATPFPNQAEMQATALERMLGTAAIKPLYSLSDASGSTSIAGCLSSWQSSHHQQTMNNLTLSYLWCTPCV